MNELSSLMGFVQVARSGSFVAAAAQLNVSQSAVSTSVSRLEKRLGVHLLKRTTRAVQLTVEGQALYDRIGDQLIEVEQALDQVRHPNSEPSGLVRLSTITTYGRYVILPILQEFLTLYPSIDVRISFHEGRRGLSRQADDLRITWGEELEAGKVARHLFTMELVMVASPAYLVRAGKPRKPGELEQHKFVVALLPNGVQLPLNIIPRSGPGKRRGAAKPFVLQPRSQLTIINELGVVTDAVCAGMGIGVTANYCVEDELRDGSLVRLLPGYEIQNQNDIPRQITIQYPPRAHMPKRVRLLLDYLIEKLQPRPV